MNFDWNAHAAAMEKKSTFLHLADRQHQLARRHSERKMLESGNSEEK